jgi:trehalose 6-phosphate synthase
MARMRRQVMEYNVYRWAATLLGDLRDLRIENGETAAEASRAQPRVVAVQRSELRKLA